MMRPFSEMTDERRCEAGAGLHYKSREWDEIFQDGGGWDGAWPEIDRHGRLTGRIVGDEAGYLNVNDEAMISEAEAFAGGWGRPDDGYAEPPPAVRVEVEVEVGHASSIPGARWCRPIGWSPRNVIDGADWSDGDGAWQDEDGDAAGIVVYGDHAEGDQVAVALDDLRVVSCGDCRVVGEVEVA
jgi:hypothetical protein